MDTDDWRTSLGPTWWGAAGLFVVLILGLGVWLLFGGSDEAAGRQAMATVTVTPPSGSAPSAGASSPSAGTPSANSAAAGTSWPDADPGCHGGTPNGAIPKRPPVPTTWVQVSTVEVPVTPAGPKTVSGDLRKCYQHSPTGALLAAINVFAASSTSSDYTRVIKSQWTPGSGRNALITELDGGGKDTPNPGPAALKGFSVARSCSPAKCLVSVATGTPTALGAIVMPMVWHQGDWYVDGTAPMPSSGPIDTLTAEFTPWGPA
ncbi:hypothetical protein [Luteipulveratus mongoliensis]|uniref:DUF8175 domain-containing protein n=1 Tax=Luteipulveratus mongoliensis TaxID=571913 RepID=A0A0K1JEM0_9MICO|nr:hypothetical protein [Luteipulveratus mongoliensis]AKU15043.1 hypothetical protein VV02_02855 [Luteipulveratus mongoliensis]